MIIENFLGTFNPDRVPNPVGVDVTQNVTVNYPTDGLLPQYVQDFKTSPDPNFKYHIKGANHIEVRNMSKSKLNGQLNDDTKKTFNLIFDRTGWFYTPIKTNP
jgi:hypothetical protein